MDINCMQVPVTFTSAVRVLDAKPLGHSLGFPVGSGWGVKDTHSLEDGGYLIKGAYYPNVPGGGLRVVFRVKTDRNDRHVWDKLMRLEIYDSTLHSVVSQQEVERNYFRKSNQFQNFVLHADLKGREHHTMEARIWYLGKADIEVERVSFILDPYKPGTPFIVNQSGGSEGHIRKLIGEAVSGLGFHRANYDGPNANDLIYVNNYYMAWVDQTGYYGKVNGIWLLNGKGGDALDFLSDTRDRGRVVNFLGVAEDGDGQWMGSYMGAEHYEIPAYVRENDDQDAALSGWYTVNEANPNLGTGGTRSIPWWVCCSGSMNNKQSFAQVNPPDTVSLKDGQLRVKYLTPITKGVDGDGDYDGDRCQANVLFHDDIRYPVYLELGYVFYKDKPYFDRTYQLVNPAGNTTLPVNTYMALIQGMIVTKIPYTIPWKGHLFTYIRPDGKDMRVPGGKDPDGRWSNLYDSKASADIIGSMQGPGVSYTISGDKSFDPGKSFYHSLYYSDTLYFPPTHADVAICQCIAHGAWEIGSGLLSNEYPIAAGKASEEVTRRFGFPQGAPIVDDKQTVNKGY